ARAADEPGGDQERDEQRRQRGQAHARRHVAEDVHSRDAIAQRVEEMEEHGPSFYLEGSERRAASASTARSSFMPRDALTRIQSPGSVQAATTRAASSGLGARIARAGSAPAPSAPATISAPSGPTAATPRSRRAACAP